MFGSALGCYLMLDSHLHASFLDTKVVEFVPAPAPVTITITCSKAYRRGDKIAARLPSGKKKHVRLTEDATKGQLVKVQVSE